MEDPVLFTGDKFVEDPVLLGFAGDPDRDRLEDDPVLEIGCLDDGSPPTDAEDDRCRTSPPTEAEEDFFTRRTLLPSLLM